MSVCVRVRVRVHTLPFLLLLHYVASLDCFPLLVKKTRKPSRIGIHHRTKLKTPMLLRAMLDTVHTWTRSLDVPKAQ